MNKQVELHQEDFPTPKSMFLNGTTITEQDALSAIDDVLEDLHNTSDMGLADATIQSLLAMQGISGKSLAKLLWGMKTWWNDADQDDVTGDTFEDHIRGIHGIKPITVARYINVWEKCEQGLIPESLRSRPLKDQIAIAATLNNYEIGKNDWKRLERANNNNEVLSILREVKGKPPKKESLQLYEERDGNITAWKNGQRRHVAWFNTDEEDDPIVHEALTRLRGDRVIRR